MVRVGSMVATRAHTGVRLNVLSIFLSLSVPRCLCRSPQLQLNLSCSRDPVEQRRPICSVNHLQSQTDQLLHERVCRDKVPFRTCPLPPGNQVRSLDFHLRRNFVDGRRHTPGRCICGAVLCNVEIRDNQKRKEP
eukprot:2758508-Rhodomonas_salina.2